MLFSYWAGQLGKFYEKNWNNYEELGKIAGFSYAGLPARFRRGEMEAQENNRYWADWSKNTGVRLDARKYPIRTGMYSNYSYIGNTLDYSSRSVMNLYKWGNYKPPVHTHFHEHTYYNNGDYYKIEGNGYFE